MQKHTAPQTVITLLLDGTQNAINLSYVGDATAILDYIFQCMAADTICVLKNTQGITIGVVRGSNILGAYPNQVDSTLTNLQIENLVLQNAQLKSNADGESWKHGKDFD